MRSGGEALTGTLTVPGDKSITHRALILGALSGGASTVRSPNNGADVRATAEVLRRLGAGIRWDPSKGEGEVSIEAFGPDGPEEPDDVLDAGNSGTTLRTILGVCAGVDAAFVVTGDASLRRRPMLRVAGPLRQMGARIDGRNHGDLAPLFVRGGDLTGIDIELPVASAQVKTAVLLAGLRADGTTSVTEPGPSRDHTERMLGAHGVEVEVAGRTSSVRGGVTLTPVDRLIPGDISSAMFLLVAAAMVPGSDLTVTGLGLNPTRTGGLEVLRSMGAEIEVHLEGESGGEPWGSVRVAASPLTGVEPDPAAVPTFIDEIPILAVAAATAEGETVIRGAGELRVKESDRIVTVVEGLRAVGVDAEETGDGLVVRGGRGFSGGRVDSRGDHRIAMAFAVAGLVARDKVEVANWSAVEVSFPEFLDVLARARGAK